MIEKSIEYDAFLQLALDRLEGLQNKEAKMKQDNMLNFLRSKSQRDKCLTIPH